MARCDMCGNEYESSFELKLHGKSYTFDCFECAASKLAPVCLTCGCRVLGHGVQSDDRVFCSAHCARAKGVQGIADHVRSQPVASHAP